LHKCNYKKHITERILTKSVFILAVGDVLTSVTWPIVLKEGHKTLLGSVITFDQDQY